MKETKNWAQASKSNAERQSAYRARKADAGKKEVRGIFATTENAEKIRRYAALYELPVKILVDR